MNRDQGIETLRTLAMFWIVFAHVAGISPGGGLGYSETPTIKYLMQTIGFFPIPMFVLISGYLYARKPIHADIFPRFLLQTVNAIMLPALGVGILLYLAKAVGYGTLDALSFKNLIVELLYPKNHLWFLYALCWTYIIIGLIQLSGLLNTPKKWLVTTLVAVVFELTTNVGIETFAISKVPYMITFFLLGFGLFHYQEYFWSKRVQLPLAILALALITFNQWTWHSGNLLDSGSFMVLERVSSLVILPLVYIYRPSIKWLAAIGPLTFIIYLFHPFGAAVSRAILFKVTNISEPIILFLICYTVGVASSVAIWGAFKYASNVLAKKSDIALNEPRQKTKKQAYADRAR